jgi:hypothetical protein
MVGPTWTLIELPFIGQTIRGTGWPHAQLPGALCDAGAP